MSKAATCPVCEDPLREAADMLLIRGNSFAETAKKLDRPPAYAAALKAHTWAKHVQGPTRENYTVLIVDYMQEARRLLDREQLKISKHQRPTIISLGHKAQQWAITQLARMEGLMITGNKRLSGDVIEALNKLAQGNPEAVKRIADARKKEIPVLTQAKRIEESKDEKD